MAHFPFRKIFIGGYTKSGTTFVGRCFDILNGVYSKGEEDYFRLFFAGLNRLAGRFNHNIRIVNREVYDGRGSIEPINEKSIRLLQQKVFLHIFFNGEDVPDDCLAIVEKTPQNIFRLKEIQSVFPDAINVCVYRSSDSVFRSLMRHMGDHRHAAFFNPSSNHRRTMLKKFCKKWPTYIDIIQNNQSYLLTVQYKAIVADTASFLNFIQDRIFGKRPEHSAPIETLSKDYFLSILPEKAREKSLIQTGLSRIALTEEELATLSKHCPNPAINFDY